MNNVYVTRPRKIEAIRWNGVNDHDVIAFAQGSLTIEQSAMNPDNKFMTLHIKWSGRTTTGYPGDYVTAEQGEHGSPVFNLAEGKAFEVRYVRASDSPTSQIFGSTP